MKGFQKSWITGCRNYKLSAPREHCDGLPHRTALSYYFKEKNREYVEEREAKQLPLSASFLAGDQRTTEQVKKKFEVAYFVAKEEMAFKKYPSILKLEEMHGVDIGNAYRNDISCGDFVDYVGKGMRNSLSQKLKNANFFSIFFDGATDNSTKDQECFYVLLFDPNSTEKGKCDKVEVSLNFLGLRNIRACDGGSTADGIKFGIEQCFDEVGITNYSEKLIGFCSDGANVNKGDKTGVKALLKEHSPWLIFIWCLSHRLELAIKEALNDTFFSVIDEILLHLYYLYEKSPKKCGELADLHQELKTVYEFDAGGLKALRSSGTRWVSHKLNAMRLLIDKFGLYMHHLQNMVSDVKSYSSDQRAKIKGFIKKWKKTSVLLNLCFYFEVLLPVSKLSLALQQEDIDPVKAIDALVTIKEKLTKLKERPVEQFSSISTIKRKSSINEDNDLVYQDVVLNEMEKEIQKLSNKQGKEFTAVEDNLCNIG